MQDFEERIAEQAGACVNGLLPDGPICPRCGGPRAPSGAMGGMWVHFPGVAARPEPAPQRNDQPSVHDLVLLDLGSGNLVREDVLERKRMGLAKYGTVLQAFNGRNALVDAYQESLDLACYLRQALEEGFDVSGAYRDALRLCGSLRGAI